MIDVVILLGGNLGDVRGHLAVCRELLTRRVGRIISLSSEIESPAWGFSAPSIFVNQALVVRTPLRPEELLLATQCIEREVGRDKACEAAERRQTQEPYASRVIDIDIITYGLQVVSQEGLIIPHAQMHRREFVLRAMVEVAAEWRHPILNSTAQELLKNITS